MIFRHRHRGVQALIVGLAVLVSSALLGPLAAHASSPAFSVGDTGPGGGVIFITPSTVGNSTSRYFEAKLSGVTHRPCSVAVAFPVNITAIAIGAGRANTDGIRDQCATDARNTSDNSAFAWVRSQSIGGYADWFIPSRRELEALWNDRANASISPITTALGTYTAVAEVAANPDASNVRISALRSSDGGIVNLGIAWPEFNSRFVIARSFSAPGAPTNVVATAGDANLTLGFTEAPDGGVAVTNYQYSTDGGSTWVTPSPAVTASPMTIGGLTNGVTYDIRLRAVNAAGAGAQSDLVTGMPRAPSTPSADPSPPEPAPTPTPTVTPTPAPKPTLDANKPVTADENRALADALAQSGSLLLVDGQRQNVTLSRTAGSATSTLTVQGDGFSMDLASIGTNGTQAQIPLLDEMLLQPGGDVVVQGQGFAPGSAVYVWLFSEPRLLATMQTDARGAFQGAVPIPADIPTGRHILQINGLAPSGAARSLSLAVQVQSPPPPRIRTAKATVSFSASSSTLDAQAKKTLRALVKGRATTIERTVSVGYAHRNNWSTANRALAQRRANAVAQYVRSLGVAGVSVTRTKGSSPTTGNAGRKAMVTITYRS